MANTFEPTPEQEASWAEWCAERPENVRKVAERFRPWKLYLLKSSFHRVTIYSFGEEKDGSVTLKVNVLAEYNKISFERQVFGVPPDDLVECDLPGPDEDVDATFTKKADIERYVDTIRPLVLAGKRGIDDADPAT